MKEFSYSLDIAAAPAAVWAVLLDVERWPQWTSTMQSVQLLQPPPFALGSAAKLRQPSLAPATWTVTELDPAAHHFAWTTKSLGVTLRAAHTLAPTPSGCALTLSLSYKGLLAPVFARVFGQISQQYMETEARGLKQRCEGTQPTAPSSN